MMDNMQCGYYNSGSPYNFPSVLGPGAAIGPGPVPLGYCKEPCPTRSLCDPSYIGACGIQPLINPFGPRRAVTTWKINYLVSNRTNQAAHTDPDLINPWGIAIFGNQLWIANGQTDTITNYDLFGNKLLGSITVRNTAQNSSYPTGIAINCTGNFATTNGTLTKSGLFLTCSEHGTVHSYNPQVDPLVSFLVLNEQLTGEIHVFRGLAVAGDVLYLADFFQSKIMVFDSNYNRLLGFPFVDGDTSDPIPISYGPTNIVNIGCYLYVVYARKDPNVPLQAITGAGFGYISIFNLDGTFVRRFTSRGVLNDPWAIVPAPVECGFPPGSLLVSNHGDGRINAFDCNGRYVGPMLNQSGLPVIIDGLRGLAPHYTDFNEIFFTSEVDENIDGLVGSICKDQVIYF
ncbi:NHL repeat-containing protein [Niemeyer virus]|uniref:NHL repeat-containing protein n=1 Tax=Acanthamoeba polyphaga mimivirus Kroon TaxID=3069720 RepID=A0A0G2Y719_9VIRU|nr:NHL repeat-containing protein [Acanthamoeba polyphaga mimivirus]AKI80384.1 NHL repeat-containing protein [Acanthamoeba polyphaga mimivirus Kroon]ALR84304.1 NHL repeat-containing protein [Niemeyer virus]